MLKLNDDDGRAVDLYLETRSAGDGQPATTPAASARIQPRIQAVSAILDLLAEMPAADPPPNLLAKTLAAVDARRGETPTVVPSDRPAVGTRIHA